MKSLLTEVEASPPADNVPRPAAVWVPISIGVIFD